jgi:hypothetical protein
MFRYSDLFPSNPNLKKKLELFSRLYAIKKELFKVPIPEYFIDLEFLKVAEK